MSRESGCCHSIKGMGPCPDCSSLHTTDRADEQAAEIFEEWAKSSGAQIVPIALVRLIAAALRSKDEEIKQLSATHQKAVNSLLTTTAALSSDRTERERLEKELSSLRVKMELEVNIRKGGAAIISELLKRSEAAEARLASAERVVEASKPVLAVLDSIVMGEVPVKEREALRSALAAHSEAK